MCEMKKSSGAQKWDAVGACFLEATSDERYFKCFCAGTKEDGEACGKPVRSFCACSPVNMLCLEYYAAHRAARWDT